MRWGALAALTLMGGALATGALADAPAAPTLPTPYTAEQIRAAWQPGFRVEMSTLAAGTETRSRMTVLSASADSVVIRTESLTASGEASEPPGDVSARWNELRDHALFEAARATRERAECRSRLGAMPGWRYATTNGRGDALTMCFADATPGPPVEHETTRDGVILSRTEHVSYGNLSRNAEEKQ